MGYFRMILFSLLTLSSVSCASADKTALEISEFAAALEQPSVITLPYKTEKHGLIFIENITIDGESVAFALDTGATHSAIFETSLRKVNLSADPHRNTMVHGMIESERRNIVKAQSFSVGGQYFGSKAFVVLSDRDLGAVSWESYDGIIGMDVLSNYKLYFSKRAEQLKLIPRGLEVPIPNQWRRVPLADANFSERSDILHTLNITIDGKAVPALLDTGAEFSVLNWKAIRNAELMGVRRRLKKDWQAQGAIGTFAPVSKVTVDSINSGQKYWADKEFVVMKLNDLKLQGALESPFAIAGMNLLWNETLLIDFEANFIAMEPRPSDSRKRRAPPISSGRSSR